MYPYQFNGILTQTRFAGILKALNITGERQPAFKDHFWEAI